MESILEKTNHELENVQTGILEKEEEEPSKKKKKKEVAYQVHKPISHSYQITSIDPAYNHKSEIYCGENAAEHFIDSLQKQAALIHKEYILNPKKMKKLTIEQQREYDSATTCHICSEKFLNDEDPKVRDHCHIMGDFRGAAHNSCNLNYRIMPKTWKLPVVFHNLRGYDGHLIIKALQKRHGKVRVIPTNMEKYLSIRVGRLQFIDSMQFTGGKSLDSLVKTLTNDKDFRYTKEAFPNEEKFELVKKKGIFPYDFFDSPDKLNYTFPKREQFFNTLGDKECSIKDYLRAKLVWDKFECKTFQVFSKPYYIESFLRKRLSC